MPRRRRADSGKRGDSNPSEPASTSKSPRTTAQPTQCPVCLDSIAASDEVQVPCGHTFCAPCLSDILALERAKAARNAPAMKRGRYAHWLRIQERGATLKCPCCRQIASSREILFTGTNKPLVRSYARRRPSLGDCCPVVESIFGQTYVQAGGIGIASYHFESPSECYISYAHAPEEWLLDDGSKPPERKEFLNAQYDATARRFTGTIIWPVPFGGDGRWDYEMVFSDDMMIIESGWVTRFNPDETDPSGRDAFEVDLSYQNNVVVVQLTTIFKQTYVQHWNYVGAASYHFNSPEDCYINYERAPQEWTLDDGAAPPRRKEFINPSYDGSTRTFTGSILWSVPFDGDSRWEYTMIFSDDFASICGGQCISFDADNNSLNTSVFGQDLHYYVY